MASGRYIIGLTPTNSNWMSEWELNNKEKRTNPIYLSSLTRVRAHAM